MVPSRPRSSRRPGARPSTTRRRPSSHACGDRSTGCATPVHPAHRVWLPPLGEPAPTLDEVLPPIVRDPQRGLAPPTAACGCRSASWTAPPTSAGRRWSPTSREAKGTWWAVAALASGKSSLLRTLVSGLALTHTPREVQFYILDFGGGVQKLCRSVSERTSGGPPQGVYQASRPSTASNEPTLSRPSSPTRNSRASDVPTRYPARVSAMQFAQTPSSRTARRVHPSEPLRRQISAPSTTAQAPGYL